MRYWLVMPAAGSGSRFGTEMPKQYAPLAGRTVIEWALAPFLADPRCQHVVVALADEDARWQQLGLAASAGARVSRVSGGAQRSQSVRLTAGLGMEPIELPFLPAGELSPGDLETLAQALGAGLMNGRR